MACPGSACCMHGKSVTEQQHLQIRLEPPEDGTLRLAGVFLLRGHIGLGERLRLAASLIKIDVLWMAPAATAGSQLAFTAAMLSASKHSKQLSGLRSFYYHFERASMGWEPAWLGRKPDVGGHMAKKVIAQYRLEQ